MAKSNATKYVEHAAFAQHTPAQWDAVVTKALEIRDAYTGPRTNIFAHIDTVLAGGQSAAVTNPDSSAMEFKFFPRDVIGKQPAKVGATFKAHFFGRTSSFRTTSMHGQHFMAVLV